VRFLASDHDIVGDASGDDWLPGALFVTGFRNLCWLRRVGRMPNPVAATSATIPPHCEGHRLLHVLAMAQQKRHCRDMARRVARNDNGSGRCERS